MIWSIKIGELARITGVTTRTIRYYEELGLIKPSKYSEGGLRLYSELDFLRLKLINNLKDLNYSLEKIKLILFADSDPVNHEANKKMNRYQEIYEQIELSISVFKNCGGCDKKPSSLICPECQEIPRGDLPVVLKSVF